MNPATAVAALDAFDELFFVVENGRVTEFNAAAASTFGDLTGRPTADLFDGSDADAIGRALDRAASSGDATVEAEPPGTVAHEFELTRLADGRIAVLGRDISERREQRRELETRERVLKRMHDVIADGDRSFDEQVRALLGLAREELGLAAGSLSRIRDGDTDFEIVDGGGPIDERESIPIDESFCDLVVSDRQTLVINGVGPESPAADRDTHTERGIACYLGAPVYLGDEVYGSLCFYDTETRTTEFSLWDVTLVDLLAQWVSYELQRRRDTERLRRQNEKLDRFASIVSHDLRNPLNVLSGSLDLARETDDEEHFDRAENAVERMEALIDDMLALARLGDSIDETERIALAEVAQESWVGVETAVGNLAVETDAVVLADRSRLRQLLENLFRNSVEHNEEAVTVTVGSTPSGFSVADDGVGIDADSREQVFESGFSTSETGTGFGLAIVEEIADAHGWDVTLTESESGGARFEFTDVDVVENEAT